MDQKQEYLAIITVSGEPRSLKRHRDGKYGGKYDPSEKDKESFAVQAMAQWNPGGFFSKRIFQVDAEFHCSGKTKDGDNLFKFIADALEGFYWYNDKQIKRHIVEVFDNVDNPRTVLKIKVL